MDSLAKSENIISLGMLQNTKLEPFATFTDPNGTTEVRCEPLPESDADHSMQDTKRKLQSMQGYDSVSAPVHRSETALQFDASQPVGRLDASTMNIQAVRADIARSKKRHDKQVTFNADSPLRSSDINYSDIQRPLPVTARGKTTKSQPIANRVSALSTPAASKITVNSVELPKPIGGPAAYQPFAQIKALPPSAHLPVTTRNNTAGAPTRASAAHTSLQFDTSQFATSSGDATQHNLHPLASLDHQHLSRSDTENIPAHFRTDANISAPQRPEASATQQLLRGHANQALKQIAEVDVGFAQAATLETSERVTRMYHQKQQLTPHEYLPILSENKHLLSSRADVGNVAIKHQLGNMQQPERHIKEQEPTSSFRDSRVNLADDAFVNHRRSNYDTQQLGGLDTSASYREDRGTEQPALRIEPAYTQVRGTVTDQTHDVLNSDVSVGHQVAMGAATQAGATMAPDDAVRPKMLSSSAGTMRTASAAGNDILPPDIHLRQRSSGAAVVNR